MSAYPLGVVDDPLENGATFSIMPQNGREMPMEGDHIVVWNQMRPGGPMAQFRGEITEITNTRGTFIIHDRRITPDWPENVHPLGRGNPVYMAKEDNSFDPDMGRRGASPKEYALMWELAKDHQDATGIEPSGAAAVVVVGAGPDPGLPREMGPGNMIPPRPGNNLVNWEVRDDGEDDGDDEG